MSHPLDSRSRQNASVSHPAILDEPHRRSALSLLDDIQIASPCPANWDDMTGDDRSRHCCSCDRIVYDLSRLTALQAEALIREKEGSLCVRLFRRADGRVLTADCPLGFEAKLRQLRYGARGVGRYWWVALLFVLAPVGWLAALVVDDVRNPVVMGGIRHPSSFGQKREQLPPPLEERPDNDQEREDLPPPFVEPRQPGDP